MLRILAVIAAIVAVILFAVGALSNDATAQTHELYWGLVALASAIGLLALDGAHVPS
jgi:hypothetical protein